MDEALLRVGSRVRATRILGWLEIERWFGFTSSLIIVPLVYLFVVGRGTVYVVSESGTIEAGRIGDT